MDRNEKILLLDVLMQDIRGDWTSYLSDRVDYAIKLARGLELTKQENLLVEYKKAIAEGYDDGRFLRKECKDGGYIGLDKLHGLSNDISLRSNEFKMESHIINNHHILTNHLD